MSIKKTETSNQERAIYILQARLNNLLGDQYLQDLPQEVKQRIKDFKNELEQCKPDNDTSNYQAIDGKILNDKDIFNIIVDASGYIKWSLEETEQLSKKQIKEIKDEFGIFFKEENIYKYRYYRSTNSRNDVNMITVTALPGYNYVEIDTDRAGIALDDLVTAEELKKELENNF